MKIFYGLYFWNSLNLEPGSCIYSPRNKVAQLYPPGIGFTELNWTELNCNRNPWAGPIMKHHLPTDPLLLRQTDRTENTLSRAVYQTGS
jgi:hypothetical protein